MILCMTAGGAWRGWICIKTHPIVLSTVLQKSESTVADENLIEEEVTDSNMEKRGWKSSLCNPQKVS